MNLKNFISEALQQPPRFAAYEISRELAKLYPEKGIIEGCDYEFDLEAFARAELCVVVSETAIHSQTKTEWESAHEPLRHEIENAWLNVLWQGRLLDVLLINLASGCDTRRHWIVAETREIAEELFRAVCLWQSEVRGEVLVFSGGGWRKNEELYHSIKSATFDGLILPDELMSELRRDLARFFELRATYERYRIAWKRGVLLIGPPGNGKTHAVKALVNELGVPCLYVKSFKAHYETEHDAMRQVFRRAREAAPCLLVLEDLDSLVTKGNRSFFLNEMDGFAANTGLVVLATTNHPERLDPALLNRPSRFDRKFYFELPAPPERERYLQRWNEEFEPEMRFCSAALVPRIVALTEGFSFAYLKELILSSMMQWVQTSQPGAMDAVIIERAHVLRSQMSSMSLETTAVADEEDNDQ